MSSSSDERRHLAVDLLDGLVDGLLQLVVLDDDGLDAEAGLKFDLVDRVQIGRIGDREKQALAAAEDRQDAVLGEQLVADQADRLEVEVDRVQVEQRHAELVRGRDGDVARVGGAARDELRDDAGLALARGVHRLEHGRFLDDPVLHEALRQAAEARRVRRRALKKRYHSWTYGKRIGTRGSSSLPKPGAQAIVKSRRMVAQAARRPA